MYVIGSVMAAAGLLWFLVAAGAVLAMGALSSMGVHLLGGGLMALVGLQMVQVTLLQKLAARPPQA